MANTSEYNRNYYLANKDKLLERKRKSQAIWAKKNPDYIKQWNLKNKEKQRKYRRNYWLKKRYGISLDEYNKLLTEQNGCCAICGTMDSGHNSNNFVVDHCHTKNKKRGILCHNCNVMLGYSGDNIQTLLSAIKYLNKHGENIKCD